MREYLVGVISYTIIGTVLVIINNSWIKSQHDKTIKKMYKIKEDILKEIEIEVKFAQKLVKEINSKSAKP